MFHQVVSELLMRSNSRVQVKIEACFPGKRLVGGKYHMGSHTVYLYKAEIKEQCIRLFGSLDRLDEYIAVIFAHELGHSEDKELNELAALLDSPLSDREEAEICLHLEKNAWRYARCLLSHMDPLFIDHIVGESLSGYYQRLELNTA
ncbi:hypothetical protein PAECIP111892_00011 [Paenibacillus auburnensis]|uniref:Peptidase M48 domain-containing protein n=1 Tax=Paenibacillus auburnensis TaxID=2905649 RepID=A0ABN8FQ12_9BACL|nr:hypothetical protein PAECIP111892_00011 [Paenibacillus auburnensis]